MNQKLLIGLVAIMQVSSGYRILIVMSGGTKSHQHFYSSIAEVLAERNHKVTFISPFKSSGNKTNIEEVVISENFLNNIVENSFEVNMLQMTLNFWDRMPRMCVDSMLEPQIQEALKNQFDMIFLSMTLSDCYFSVVHEKNVPFGYLFPNILSGPLPKMAGFIDYPSVSPNMMLELKYPMSFRQRVLNACLSLFIELLTTYYTNPTTEAECRKRGVWRPEMPSLNEMQKGSSLTIINSIKVLEKPVKPYPPTVICAGGLHVRPSKPLKQDLEKWIQESGEEGFIFFSLGTHVKPSDMKKEHRKILLDVFNSLKQRVIWKWDEPEIEGLGPNVRIGTWFPQQDILGHPKIRLFISHGGLLSVQEATYFGVPIVGMPVFADQFNNVFRMTSEGWGLRIDWKDLTEDKFRNVILEAINSEGITQLVQQRAKLMKDRPMSAAEEVTYWVEYVIRHNGAKHMQGPLSDLFWYQIYNVDVWMTVLSTVLLTLAVLFYIIKYCLQKIIRKCKKKQD